MTMLLTQSVLPNIGLSLQDRIDRAIDLLREHEPKALELSPDGYWLAFSGGKDSQVILKLAEMAGVKFRPAYSQTTIDPPELIRFIKAKYPHVEWNRPKRNFFKAVELSHGLPTRLVRWCCEEFKESGGDGMVKILGVRRAESISRKKRWSEITLWRSDLGGFAVCPIVDWQDDEVWQFIHRHIGFYCSLYDEGFKRLGCVGCPMAGQQRLVEFARWPGFEKAWRHAFRKYFDSRKGKLNRFGEPYYLERFATADEMFDWWLSEKPSPAEEDDCLGLWDDAQ